MAGSQSFLSAIESRRTYYQLTAKSPISDKEIQTIVERAVKYVPSAFNTQSGRAIVLFGEANQSAWSIVKGLYVDSVKSDATQVETANKKIAEYAAGYGSVFFFEDQSVLDVMNAKMPYFKQCNAFEIWSENSTGMLQFAVWTALEAEGFGASLQHHATYVPAINKALQEKFDLPASWKSTAMMPFGIPTGEPGNAGHPKTFAPIEDRVKVFAK